MTEALTQQEIRDFRVGGFSEDEISEFVKSNTPVVDTVAPAIELATPAIDTTDLEVNTTDLEVNTTDLEVEFSSAEGIGGYTTAERSSTKMIFSRVVSPPKRCRISSTSRCQSLLTRHPCATSHATLLMLL